MLVQFKRIARSIEEFRIAKREQFDRDFPPRDGRPSLKFENIALTLAKGNETYTIVRLGRKVLEDYGPMDNQAMHHSTESRYESVEEAVEAMRQRVGRRRMNGWEVVGE
jgi:hypothetical protein